MKSDPAPNPLSINPALVEQILVRFIRNEIHRTGFRRAVFGLSGGVDSSVVAYLAVRAMGPDNVLAVTMPYKTSSDETQRDSRAVVEALGVQSLEVPITPQVDAYVAAMPGLSRMRLANKCARERMTILYDQSAAFEGLVVGTSNKTELLLGYGTQFGDLASAINPIGDLYKTQLRQLAAHLGVPDAILQKAPSGDLWVGQTDEGELGFSYAEVDRLLVLLVDRRWQPAQLVRAGFDPEFVDRVLTLIRRNHYKRRLPVIAKLSEPHHGPRLPLPARLGDVKKRGWESIELTRVRLIVPVGGGPGFLGPLPAQRRLRPGRLRTPTRLLQTQTTRGVSILVPTVRTRLNGSKHLGRESDRTGSSEPCEKNACCEYCWQPWSFPRWSLAVCWCT